MKRFFALFLAALLLFIPSAALAKGSGTPPVYVPPNQSAASQYTEDVPTAGGDTATKNVHHSAAAVSSGSHGGGSGGVSGGGSSSGGTGSAIASSTLSAMSSHGSTGAAAASVAKALAPVASVTHLSAKAKPSSATGQVVNTLTGSDAGSGVGVLLPIILIGSLVAATVAGLSRLRRPGTAS